MNLPILMYHHLEPDGVPLTPYTVHAGAFEKQLDWLRRSGFIPLTFQDLFAALDVGAPLPAKPVILTFDDGYESFRELALPRLAARNMKATVFIVAGEIGNFNRWDVERGIAKRALMGAAGIQEIVTSGMEIGSHGWVHRNLNECSATEQQEEISRPGPELERRFGVRPQAFAYPYGAHSRRHFDWLQAAGYRGAVSIFSDQPAVTTNLFSMRRIYIHPGDGRFRFRMKMSPLYLRHVGRRDSKRITTI